jgi:tyrosyl-tRNA synthetase
MVHGEEGLAAARTATAVLFGEGEIQGMSAGELLDIFSEVPSSTVPDGGLSDAGMAIVDLVVLSGLEQSKKQARNLIEHGGLYLNSQRVEDISRAVTLADAIDGQVLVLRKGKKQYHLIRVDS